MAASSELFFGGKGRTSSLRYSLQTLPSLAPLWTTLFQQDLHLTHRVSENMDTVYSPHPCIKGFFPTSFLLMFFLYSDWTNSLHPLSDLSLFYSNFSRVDFLVIYTTLLLTSTSPFPLTFQRRCVVVLGPIKATIKWTLSLYFTTSTVYFFPPS